MPPWAQKVSTPNGTSLRSAISELRSRARMFTKLRFGEFSANKRKAVSLSLTDIGAVVAHIMMTTQ